MDIESRALAILIFGQVATSSFPVPSYQYEEFCPQLLQCAALSITDPPSTFLLPAKPVEHDDVEF